MFEVPQVMFDSSFCRSFRLGVAACFLAVGASTYFVVFVGGVRWVGLGCLGFGVPPVA
jgi:hypothetical protein